MPGPTFMIVYMSIKMNLFLLLCLTNMTLQSKRLNVHAFISDISWHFVVETCQLMIMTAHTPNYSCLLRASSKGPTEDKRFSAASTLSRWALCNLDSRPHIFSARLVRDAITFYHSLTIAPKTTTMTSSASSGSNANPGPIF